MREEMSDKPKTIQEALAEVQRHVNEQRIAEIKKQWEQVEEGTALVPYVGVKQTDWRTVTPPSPPPAAAPSTGGALSKVGGALKAVGRVAGPIATAASVTDMAGSLATGTETGRSVGKWIGDNVPGAKTAADAMRKAGEAIGVREPSSDRFANVPRTITREPGSPEAKSAAEKLKIDKKAPSVGLSGDVMKPGGGSAPTQSKYSTSKIGNVDVKKGDTVSGIIARQRKIDPTYNMDKFKAQNPHIKDVNKIAAGSRVNVNSKKSTNESRGNEMDLRLMRDILADIQMEEYIKRLAAENEIDINELTDFGSAFASARKAGKTEFSFGGKSYGTKLASPSSSSPNRPRSSTPNLSTPKTDTPGTQGVAAVKGPVNPKKPFAGVDAAVAKAEKATPKVGAPATPQDGAARFNVNGKRGGEIGASSSDGSTISLDRPGNVGARPAGAGAAGTVTSPTPAPKPAAPEQSRAAPGTFAARSASGELKADEKSASVKKLMSMEQSNPLIAAFLKLQEKETSNIFVEAKKLAKKDHDGDGNIESEKDEVWGSRFRAAKAAGKLKEEEQVDEDLATAMTLGGLAGTAAAPFVAKGVNKAMDYLEKKRMKKYSDERKAKKSVKKEEVESSKMPKDWGEEVSFSESELAYFASIDEVGSVTPMAPTDAKEVSVKSDKSGKDVPQRDLTDAVVEEGRKKKVDTDTVGTGERDARQHIQVIAGQAAGGREVDFKHNNGKSTKIGPDMGRKITAHLNGLKPAERQAKVKAMHDSPEGMKF